MTKILISGPCAEDRLNGISYFGGAGGGIALNLAQAGIATGLISALGKDSFSEKYKNHLLALNVDISYLTQNIQQLPVMTLLSQGNTEFARDYQPNGAREELAAIQPTEAYLNSFDYLHVVNTPRQLAEHLADKYQGSVSYCPGSLFMRDHNSLSETLLNKAAYVFTNQEEYDLLIKRVDFSTLFQSNLKALLLTKGEEGITIIQKESEQHVPLQKVEQPQDVTGAGDAVVVGFYSKLLQGAPLEEAISYGQLLASKVVQQHGVVLPKDQL